MSGIGLIGTSSTGKTTLAVEIAKRTGIPFLESKARMVHKMFGIDVDKKCNHKLKMMAQQKMLEVIESDYQSVNGIFVADRTPMDYASYVLCEALSDNLTKDQEIEVMEYVEKCYRLTNLYFHSVILIQPVIKLVVEEGRPSSAAYAQHINMIMTGIMADPCKKLHCAKHFLEKSIINLNRRADTVIKIAAMVEMLNVRQGESSTNH